MYVCMMHVCVCVYVCVYVSAEKARVCMYDVCVCACQAALCVCVEQYEYGETVLQNAKENCDQLDRSAGVYIHHPRARRTWAKFVHAVPVTPPCTQDLANLYFYTHAKVCLS